MCGGLAGAGKAVFCVWTNELEEIGRLSLFQEGAENSNLKRSLAFLTSALQGTGHGELPSPQVQRDRSLLHEALASKHCGTSLIARRAF